MSYVDIGATTTVKTKAGVAAPKTKPVRVTDLIRRPVSQKNGVVAAPDAGIPMWAKGAAALGVLGIVVLAVRSRKKKPASAA